MALTGAANGAASFGAPASGFQTADWPAAAGSLTFCHVPLTAAASVAAHSTISLCVTAGGGGDDVPGAVTIVGSSVAPPGAVRRNAFADSTTRPIENPSFPVRSRLGA